MPSNQIIGGDLAREPRSGNASPQVSRNAENLIGSIGSGGASIHQYTTRLHIEQKLDQVHVPSGQRPVESGAASLKGQNVFGRDIVDLKSFTTSDEKIKVNAQSITVELQASDEASLLSKNKI